jgi:(E)-2-((N-methylformamido)methylene)succinate hydrolase
MPRTPEGTAYEIAGPENAPAIVMIHGMGLTRAVWKWLQPALTSRYRVLSYDLLGHGESLPPPANPTLSTLSDQLDLLMNRVGLAKAAVVGFSLGGMVARRFAQDHPERVLALGILNSPHRRSTVAQDAIAKRAEQATATGPSTMVEAALERWFTEAFRLANPELMETVRGWMLANDPASYQAVYRILADGIDEIVAPHPAIDCPTIIITGDEDFGNGPEMASAIANEIAGAQVLILPGLRHMALAEAPNAVEKPLLAFLDHYLKDEAIVHG